MTGVWVRRAVLCLSLGSALSACPKRVPPPEARREGNGTTVTLRGESLSFVTVEAARTPPTVAQRAYVGRVDFDERRVSRVGPPVGGRVTAVNVIVGDTVTSGQTLATIHSGDIATALAQLAQARAARLLAEQSAERSRRLVETGNGSQAEAQQSATQLTQARSEESRAQAALSALGGGRGVTGSDDYQLRAPMAGVVVERHVAVGNEVHTDQDQPLVVVADLSRVWVLAEIYESDLANVQQGNDAVVEITALPDHEPFTGRVTSLSRVLDPSTRTATARIELDNTGELLRPGMSARVRIAEREQGSADVPTSAILARRDEFFVFVRTAEGTFRRQQVQLGEQHGDHIVIRDGLRPNDMVATQGAILLDAEANAL